MRDQLSLSLSPESIFANVRTDAPLIVAVSGGSDSTALLNLAASWASITDVDLRVVTVDHGLRPEAAAEAAFVAGVCEGLGLQHFTLAWQGMKPVTGISESARHARYLLIEEFACDVGATEILVGHTCDDQAETVWMRNSRNGGNPQFRGLSGMPELMLLPSGVRVRRPLLNHSRQELRDYLMAIGQVWIEDPSNHDRSYERVRARQNIVHSEIDKDQICRLAKLVGRQRRVAASKVAEILMENLEIRSGPVFSVPAHVLVNPNDTIAALIAQVLVAIAGGREHFVSYQVSKNIIAMLPGERFNSGCAIIEYNKSSFTFYRERRNLAAMHIPPYGHVVWDNRILIENDTEQSFLCCALDYRQLKLIDQSLSKQLKVEPRAVLQSMAVLVSEGGQYHLPFVPDKNTPEGLRFTYKVPAIENYCSEYDIDLIDVVNFVSDRLDAVDASPGLKE
ncbi:MAG: tRNA lysidine(34) synthetase TilS [Pseudomonadota bacterium]